MIEIRRTRKKRFRLVAGEKRCIVALKGIESFQKNFPIDLLTFLFFQRNEKI